MIFLYIEIAQALHWSVKNCVQLVHQSYENQIFTFNYSLLCKTKGYVRNNSESTGFSSPIPYLEVDFGWSLAFHINKTAHDAGPILNTMTSKFLKLWRRSIFMQSGKRLQVLIFCRMFVPFYLMSVLFELCET